MEIQTIKRLISEFPESDFAGAVSEEAIDAASVHTKLPIKSGYRDFLRNFGCGGVESEEFIGLGGPKHLNVVDVTETLRSRKGPSGLPRHLMPILADGYGNYVCLDAEHEIVPDEPVVVFWLHDGGDNQVCERISDTYLEWLASTLMRLRDEILG